MKSLVRAPRPLRPQPCTLCGRQAKVAAPSRRSVLCFDALFQRQPDGELEYMMELLRERQGPEPLPGPKNVYLVGTGPGDPGLLTLQALQLLQTADVVLYDRLVTEDIIRMASPSARLVYVGKQKGYHSRTQEQIHALLANFADAGARVVRLKGGDPFVFGRGAEESQYLEARGITVHISAGITAAAGISAILGLPLTHRGVATSVRFLTGHAREGGDVELDGTIAAAHDESTTLVIYMGLGTLPRLVEQLRDGGMCADVPAIAVERGTTPESRLVHGRVGELAELTLRAGLQSPTLIVVGDVVALSPGWRWWVEHGEPLVMAAPMPLALDLSAFQQPHGLPAAQLR